VRTLAPNAPVFYLNGDLAPEVLSMMKATGPDYNLNVFLKNPAWVKEAQDLGQKVNVWTVNRPEDIQKMIDLKVDYITTDEPLLVREMLDKQ
jgi:glycerophosphoryl diester phosphodiesterase